MRITRWLILLVCVVGVAGRPASVDAQLSETPSSVRTAGAVANLFATVDPGRSFDGMRLELPEAWELEHVRLLRYGTEPVSIHRRRLERGTVLLTTDRPVHGPHELVLRVRLPDTPGTVQWHVTPFVQSADQRGPEESGKSHRVLSAERLSREVVIEEASRPSRDNQALDLSEAETPLLLPADSLPALGRLGAFTIEFWMRTAGLEEVIVSTWNGDEDVAYSAEFIVDRSGRLRFYCGQPGQHQALRSNAPVADDQWHHVALTYDVAEARLRLHLDGTLVDSTQPRALPQSPGPVPMALGGRVRPGRDTVSEALAFSGQIDELRIWEEARSTEVLRTMRKRPFAAQAAETSEQGPLRLSFDTDEELEHVDWPDGGQRVATSLSFRSALQNLRAETQGRTVVLRWEADASEEGRFVVERSPRGNSFTPVARLRPREASRSPSDPSQFVYTDEDVQEQVVFYRIRRVEPEGGVEHTSGTIKIGLGAETEQASETELLGNYPNPFVKSTTIAYEVHKTQPVTLTVWNLAGHRVATLADEVHEPGYHEKILDAGGLPSGTYFARLQTPEDRQSLRLVVLR